MKKEISPAVIVGAIVGVVAVVVLVIFFVVKTDPASQAPNAPPRFDSDAKAAESHTNPQLNRTALPDVQGRPRH